MAVKKSANQWASGNRRALAVIGVIVASVWASTALSGGDDDAGRDQSPAAAAVRTVLYEIEGSVKWADVTMETPTGTRQETPDVPLVTTDGQRGLRFAFKPGAFVYIAAQMKGERGSITCRISVDGVVISENTSSASYGIATCKGSV